MTRAKVCLVLGGAANLKQDIAGYKGPIDAVVACNDAGTIWDGELDAWVSLHARMFEVKGWRKSRDDAGRMPAHRYFSTWTSQRIQGGRHILPEMEFTEVEFPGQEKGECGSSGLFAAKVAMVDLGFDRVVFAGVPMAPMSHFFDEEEWAAFKGFRASWLTVPEEYRRRMRSMSGWTRVLLGKPKEIE